MISPTIWGSRRTSPGRFASLRAPPEALREAEPSFSERHAACSLSPRRELTAGKQPPYGRVSMNSELSRALCLIQELLDHRRAEVGEMQLLLRGSGLEEPLFYEAIGWLVKEQKLTVLGDRVRWHPTRLP